MTWGKRAPAKRAITQEGARQAVAAIIIGHGDLSKIDAAWLARTHNVARTPEARLRYVQDAIAAERERRGQ